MIIRIVPIKSRYPYAPDGSTRYALRAGARLVRNPGTGAVLSHGARDKAERMRASLRASRGLQHYLLGAEL